MEGRRELICCPSIYYKVTAAFPKRKVHGEAHSDVGTLYWFGYMGRVRMVKNDNPSIVWVTDRWRGFPHIKVRRKLRKGLWENAK